MFLFGCLGEVSLSDELGCHALGGPVPEQQQQRIPRPSLQAGLPSQDRKGRRSSQAASGNRKAVSQTGF